MTASKGDGEESSTGKTLGSKHPNKMKNVPIHPKWCPECLQKGQRSKVKIFNLNEDKEAIYMCTNMKVSRL